MATRVNRRYRPRTLPAVARPAMIHSTRAPMSEPSEESDTVELWPAARLLEARTLPWALRNRSYSLKTACKGFGIPGKLDHKPNGCVDLEEIKYCRQDVRSTVGLLNAVKQEFDLHLNYARVPTECLARPAWRKAISKNCTSPIQAEKSTMPMQRTAFSCKATSADAGSAAFAVGEREQHGNNAVKNSLAKVERTKGLFVEQVSALIKLLHSNSFYEIGGDSYEAAFKRVQFLKQTVEQNDGYKFFWLKNEPIEREKDLQLIYRLTWFGTRFSVDSEVNNGRGPVDYKISDGAKDSSLVEFKLASNTKLRDNLENQVEVYKKANLTQKSVKVII